VGGEGGGWDPGPYHVGISGWRYPPWRGVFYPPGLAHRRELEYASRSLASVEVNGSFYALQRPSSYQQWRSQTPDGFVFSVKGPRFVTHMKRLAGVEVPLANFFASGVLAPGDQLGPVLWQLPPTMGYDADRLAAFFALLPRTTRTAAQLATQHDQRLDGRAFAATDADRPLRHALELRHASFENVEFVQLLRDNDIALACADTAGRWPVLGDVTSEFVYARLHGDRELYVGGYGDTALDLWAARIRTCRWEALPQSAAGSAHRHPCASVRCLSTSTTTRWSMHRSTPSRSPVGSVSRIWPGPLEVASPTMTATLVARWLAHPCSVRTAAPRTRPSARSRSATSACSNGMGVVVTWTLSRCARTRNSSPSRRVLLVTLQRVRSPNRWRW